MPSLMLVPLAVLEELKQTHRQTDRIALYILDAHELMLGLHDFRQTGPPRRVDCLAPPPVCHMKMKASR